MQRLMLSSEKRQTFTRGKNKQEDTRLGVIKTILEKAITSYNLNCYKEEVELNKTLDEIQSTTNQVNDEDDFDDSMLTFKTVKTTSTGKSSFYAPSSSTGSKFQRNKKKYAEQSEFDSSSFTSNRSKFTISKFDDYDRLNINSADLYSRKLMREQIGPAHDSSNINEIPESYEETNVLNLQKSSSASITRIYFVKCINIFITSQINWLTDKKII